MSASRIDPGGDPVMGHPSHFARGEDPSMPDTQVEPRSRVRCGCFTRFRISARLFGFRNSIFPQTDRFAGRERALRSGLRAPFYTTRTESQGGRKTGPDMVGESSSLGSRLRTDAYAVATVHSKGESSRRRLSCER